MFSVARGIACRSRPVALRRPFSIQHGFTNQCFAVEGPSPVTASGGRNSGYVPRPEQRVSYYYLNATGIGIVRALLGSAFAATRKADDKPAGQDIKNGNADEIAHIDQFLLVRADVAPELDSNQHKSSSRDETSYHLNDQRPRQHTKVGTNLSAANTPPAHSLGGNLVNRVGQMRVSLPGTWHWLRNQVVMPRCVPTNCGQSAAQYS